MVRLPANVVVGVVVTFTHPRARAIVPCVYVCTTVNITHPPGATFQAQLLDNQEGANIERYVFRKLSARCLQRRPFRHRHYRYPNCRDIGHGKSAQRGVVYTVVLYG